MFDLEIIPEIVIFSIWMIVLLFSSSIHECAHALVAYKCGDDTAKREGRITLNPIKHIDLVGTILVPTLSFFLGGFVLAWAKPVPVNLYNLRNQSASEAMISAAGPFSNLILALLFALAVKFSPWFSLYLSDNLYDNLYYLLRIGVRLNVILFVFNLLPIPPLDGSRIAFCSIKAERSNLLYNYDRYGSIILMFLVYNGLISELIKWPVDKLYYTMV